MVLINNSAISALAICDLHRPDLKNLFIQYSFWRQKRSHDDN